MNDDLYLLITIVRKKDMDLLKYVYKCKLNTEFSQNYMYWNEPDIKQIYSEIFDFDEDVVILAVEEINGLICG